MKVAVIIRRQKHQVMTLTSRSPLALVYHFRFSTHLTRDKHFMLTIGRYSIWRTKRLKKCIKNMDMWKTQLEVWTTFSWCFTSETHTLSGPRWYSSSPHRKKNKLCLQVRPLPRKMVNESTADSPLLAWCSHSHSHVWNIEAAPGSLEPSSAFSSFEMQYMTAECSFVSSYMVHHTSNKSWH